MVTALRTDRSSRVAWLLRVYQGTRKLRLPWLSLSIIAILVVCAAFAPLLAPNDPEKIRILDAKLAPGRTWNTPLELMYWGVAC